MEESDKGTRQTYKKLVDIIAKWQASKLSKNEKLQVELGQKFLKAINGDINNASLRLYPKDIGREIIAELERRNIPFVKGPDSNGQTVVYTANKDAEKVKACQRCVYCTHPEHYNETTIQNFLEHEKKTEMRCVELKFDTEQQQTAFRKFANNREKGFVVTNVHDSEGNGCAYASAANLLGHDENTGVCDALVMTALTIGGTNWDLKSAKMCWDIEAENQILDAVENGSSLVFVNEADNQSSYLLVESHQLKLFERDENGNYTQRFNNLTISEGRENLRAAMQSILSRVENKKAMLPHDFDEFMKRSQDEVKADWITKLCKDAVTLGVLDINDEKIPEIVGSLTCRPTLDDMFAKAKDVQPVKFFLRKEFKEPLCEEFRKNAPIGLTEDEKDTYAKEKVKEFEMKYSIEFEQEYLKNKLSKELIETAHINLENRRDLITPENKIMAYKTAIIAALPECVATKELRAWLDATNNDPTKSAYLSRVGGTNDKGKLLSFDEIRENIFSSFSLIQIRNIMEIEQEQQKFKSRPERANERAKTPEMKEEDSERAIIGTVKD